MAFLLFWPYRLFSPLSFASAQWVNAPSSNTNGSWLFPNNSTVSTFPQLFPLGVANRLLEGLDLLTCQKTLPRPKKNLIQHHTFSYFDSFSPLLDLQLRLNMAPPLVARQPKSKAQTHELNHVNKDQDLAKSQLCWTEMPAKDTPLEKLGSPLATNGQGQKKLAELPADDVHQEKSGSPIAVTPGVHDKIGSSGGPHLCAGELEAPR